MTRNNKLLLATIASLVLVLAVIKVFQFRHPETEPRPIVLYEVLPHPYFTGVQSGGQAYADEHRVAVRFAVGQESSQGNVNQNVESLFTLGHKEFAIYPVDPAGSKGLFGRLHRAGCLVVAYGAPPEAGTETPFAIATDTRKAATLAAEELVKLMDRRGRILNVLESLTDANTPIRRAAIEAVVARHPDVQIIQTIGDITTEQKAREKIESALVARGDEVDGVICTGYTTTVAAATLLADRNRRPGAKRIRFVGLDDDKRVLAAIRDGSVDMTLAQNPPGQGYVSCALLDLMRQGWKPKAQFQFIDSGCVPVTKANVDSFQTGIEVVTKTIVAELKTRYLDPPAK